MREHRILFRRHHQELGREPIKEGPIADRITYQSRRLFHMINDDADIRTNYSRPALHSPSSEDSSYHFDISNCNIK